MGSSRMTVIVLAGLILIALVFVWLGLNPRGAGVSRKPPTTRSASKPVATLSFLNLFQPIRIEPPPDRYHRVGQRFILVFSKEHAEDAAATLKRVLRQTGWTEVVRKENGKEANTIYLNKQYAGIICVGQITSKLLRDAGRPLRPGEFAVFVSHSS